MVEDSFSAEHEESRNTIEKLGVDRLLELVSSYAHCESSRKRIKASIPFGKLEEIEDSQARIWETLRLRESGEDLPFSGWKDSSAFLRRISARGAVATGEELALIAASEASAAELSRYIDRNRDAIPSLALLLPRFELQPSVVKSISSVLDPEFNLIDRASPELARIRKKISSVRSGLRKDFSSFAAEKGKGTGNEFVTVRGDRFVVSLPRTMAGHVKGIVHQASGSGASLYIEPLEFVERNNQLESLLQQEKKEVSRILGKLTSLVFDARDGLMGNQETVLEIDLVSAKASFAASFRCTRPLHGEGGAMKLRQARHPLLEKKLAGDPGGTGIVGLDLDCEDGLSVLVISGPNAGGKTIVLKTVGLLVMMDRLGLLLPCATESIIPDYRAVFVDIGDDQSIEKSLSTFSSRIARLRRILSLVSNDSLVLIDEIGDGTDPEEGAAIGMAVMEELSRRCGRTIVSTHMSMLKGWAHREPGAENATLEFDPENLQPLYRLRMGVPGRSWGIEMAGRMGLPEHIVARAKEGVSSGAMHLEELLSHLEKTESLLEREKEELVSKEMELARLVSSYRENLDTIEKERDNLARKARKEALDIVTATRVEMENLVREIRMSQAERETIRRSKERISRKKLEFEESLSETKRPETVPADIKDGDWVRISSLGKLGRVLSVEDSSRVLVELTGGIRVETKVEDLEVTAEKKTKKNRGRISWTARDAGPVETELMIRGLERAEAMERVDAFIDRAVLGGLGSVTIIHGIGKGILKRAVYDMLKRDPRVEDIHPGEPALGGDGVAVVKLK